MNTVVSFPHTNENVQLRNDAGKAGTVMTHLPFSSAAAVSETLLPPVIVSDTCAPGAAYPKILFSLPDCKTAWSPIILITENDLLIQFSVSIISAVQTVTLTQSVPESLQLRASGR